MDPMLVSRKWSISRVTKIFVILAHEVLDGLLLRIGIEINDGPLANALNMALLPKKNRSHVIFLLPLVFAWGTGQGRSQRVVREPMHPRDSAGLLKNFLLP